MASLGHIAVGCLVGDRFADRADQAPRWLWRTLFSVLSYLPDADVVAFFLGIPYHAPFGHRGASHSVAAAALVGLAVAFALRSYGLPFGRSWLYATGTMASHGLLDAMTNGGLGVAFLWPFSVGRYFAPWRPIPVSPIGLRNLLRPYGFYVLAFEAVIFGPVFYLAFHRRRSRAR